MKPRCVRRCVLVAFSLAAAPIASSVAQESNPPAGSNPVGIERVQNGFVIAPDFKISKVDGTSARLAGAYGGWMIDNTLLVGGGGYWLTNGSSGRKMAYGGAVIEWLERTNRPVGCSVRGLVGYGTSRLSDAVTILADQPGDGDERPDERASTTRTAPIATVAHFAFYRDFFVAEPQADLLINISRRLRIDVGAGYRAIGGAEGVARRLRGATGSISLEIGGSSSVRMSRP